MMQVRGLSPDTANLAASILWLGLAAGCAVVPWWSDAIKRRKLPVLVGIVVQGTALAALVYVPGLGTPALMALWFAFGAGAAAHILAFTMAGDIVEPAQIGTSAALVNGAMFVVGGVLIARPGSLASAALSSVLPVTLESAATAARPLLLALVLALVLAALIPESYPAPAKS
jgi:MFS family permease